jgi:hypothetical protein
MSEKDSFWSMKLDWLNILNSLKLDSINQIPEFKREKAIKKVTKIYDIDTLMELDPIELDKLVVHELRELMRKELGINARKKQQLEQEMQSKFVPFKNGGVFKINPQDFKDLDIDPENADPEEILKQIAKKLMKDDDDDSDDDKKKYKEDNTGYYI